MAWSIGLTLDGENVPILTPDIEIFLREAFDEDRIYVNLEYK